MDRYEAFALFAEQMDKREKFKNELLAFVKKHKKIPKQYLIEYNVMKNEKPWYQNKKLIRQLKRVAKKVEKNERRKAKCSTK
jgi:hypothetical protein